MDKNSVVFLKKQVPAFDELRAGIEAGVAAHHTPQAQTPSSGSVADEMAELGALPEQWLLSPEEFQQQKARLLGG
ncbi:hypothetical protein ABZ341_42175 [Streptomyces sp. NPDC006173]|uniref:hypothetical protein n=1 Tax=Streptomyces sp. NPDC006173 TaxID=3155349 RepID=UPI0033E7484C